jgi:hypothetical protein
VKDAQRFAVSGSLFGISEQAEADTLPLHLPKSAINDKLWLVFPKEYGMVSD